MQLHLVAHQDVRVKSDRTDRVSRWRSFLKTNPTPTPVGGVKSTMKAHLNDSNDALQLQQLCPWFPFIKQLHTPPHDGDQHVKQHLLISSVCHLQPRNT